MEKRGAYYNSALKGLSASVLTPGTVWKEPSTGMEFVYVPGGEFVMGDLFGDGNDDEKPAHTVIVSGFWLGRYPVTCEEYNLFCRETGHKRPDDRGWGEGRKPAVRIDWHDADEFVRWLSWKTGMKFRLPTEAEWEYAARSGGKRERWAGTNNERDLQEYAWFSDNSSDRPQVVGLKRPNGLGLYDMSGNVWEWVSDYYDKDYYKTSPMENPRGPESGKYRVLRGGCFLYDAKLIRTTERLMGEESTLCYGKGFRVALEDMKPS
jgi:formylglycine-generating enzyme required for sulfatase activity